MPTGNGRPYRGGRAARLIAEGLIDPNADLTALDQPVHAERIEHLLLVIACALTRTESGKIAPWTRKKVSIAELKAAMGHNGKQRY